MGKKIIDGREVVDSASEDPNNCENVPGVPDWALEQHYASLQVMYSPCEFCETDYVAYKPGPDGELHFVSEAEWGGKTFKQFNAQNSGPDQGPPPRDNTAQNTSQSVGSKASSTASHLSRGLISSGAAQVMNSVRGGGGSSPSSIRASGSERRRDPKAQVSPEHAKPSRRLGAGFGAFLESRSKAMIQRSTGDSVQDLLDPQLYGNKDISPFSGRKLLSSYGERFDDSRIPQLEYQLVMQQERRRALLSQGKSIEDIQPEQDSIKKIRVELQQARVEYDVYIERADYTEYAGGDLDGAVQTIKDCDKNIDEIRDQLVSAQEKLFSLGQGEGNESEMETTQQAISGLQYDLEDQMGRRKGAIGDFKDSLKRNA